MPLHHHYLWLRRRYHSPKLLDLIEQLENLSVPDSFSLISHLLMDAGATDFIINDPKTSDIKQVPPSIGFSVSNLKFQGKVSIVYDFGSDTYCLSLSPNTDNPPIMIDNIHFD